VVGVRTDQHFGEPDQPLRVPVGDPHPLEDSRATQVDCQREASVRPGEAQFGRRIVIKRELRMGQVSPACFGRKQTHTLKNRGILRGPEACAEQSEHGGDHYRRCRSHSAQTPTKSGYRQ